MILVTWEVTNSFCLIYIQYFLQKTTVSRVCMGEGRTLKKSHSLREHCYFTKTNEMTYVSSEAVSSILEVSNQTKLEKCSWGYIKWVWEVFLFWSFFLFVFFLIVSWKVFFSWEVMYGFGIFKGKTRTQVSWHSNYFYKGTFRKSMSHCYILLPVKWLVLRKPQKWNNRISDFFTPCHLYMHRARIITDHCPW